MAYQDTKVYYDGSHYIAIPKRPAPRHRGARLEEDPVEVIEDVQNEATEDVETTTESPQESPLETPKKPAVKRRATRRELFNELYQKLLSEPKRSRRGKLIQGMRPYFKTEEEAIEYVDKQLERKQRNLICRRMRFSRKVNLHEFNYFCTFTYDGSLHTEKTFRERLAVCFNRFCSRKGWKYAGVWERSPKTGRLHFHGIFYIPEGTMPGILYEKEDYNFNTHRRQVTIQNTYFNERFGRCDIEPINDRTEMGSAMAYIMKYIEKSGEKIVYSRGLPQYFKSDILDDDIVCTVGMEDQKFLLFDNFSCFEDGVYIGEVSPEVIKQMKKAN